MIHFFCKICRKFVGDRRLAREHMDIEHYIVIDKMDKLKRFNIKENYKLNGKL